MGCLFAILAVLSPRLALILVWLFTPLVDRAFNGFLLPILGFVFLPFTTLIYLLVYSPVNGLQGFDWVWLILAAMLDLSAYAGSGYTNKDKIPGYGGEETKEKKEENKE